MVVDDDPEQPVLMRAILEPLGFAVLSARDGPTCLSLVADRTCARPLRARRVHARHGRLGAGPGAARARARGADPDDVGQPRRGAAGRRAAPAGDAAHHDAVLPKPFDLARLIDLLGSLLALDWIEGAAAPAAPSRRPAPARRSGRRPAGAAAADLAELRRLCAIGYVRGLEAKLGALGDAPPRGGACASASPASTSTASRACSTSRGAAEGAPVEAAP